MRHQPSILTSVLLGAAIPLCAQVVPGSPTVVAAQALERAGSSLRLEGLDPAWRRDSLGPRDEGDRLSESGCSIGDLSECPRLRVASAAQRVTGRLVGVESEALTLMPDGRSDPIRFALRSVTALDVSEGRGARAAAHAAGLGVGTGLGVLVGVLVASAIRPESPGPMVSPVPRVAAVAAAGSATVLLSRSQVYQLVRRERWRRIPVEAVASLNVPAEAPR